MTTDTRAELNTATLHPGARQGTARAAMRTRHDDSRCAARRPVGAGFRHMKLRAGFAAFLHAPGAQIRVRVYNNISASITRPKDCVYGCHDWEDVTACRVLASRDQKPAGRRHATWRARTPAGAGVA